MPTLEVIVRAWSIECEVVPCPRWKVSVQPGRLKISDVIINLLLLRSGSFKGFIINTGDGSKFSHSRPQVALDLLHSHLSRIYGVVMPVGLG